MLEPVIYERPAHPPGELGAATYRAAVQVDRAAVQLLGACGPFDPAPARLAQLQAFLATWPAVQAAVQELAAEIQASALPAPANDTAPARASA